MDKKAHVKALIDLYNIAANFAMLDYIQANYNKNGKRKSKKHIPYSLSDETLQAQEMYKIVYSAIDPTEINKEDEEKVKAYLLRFRIFNTQYLQDRGGRAYFENRLKELEMINV